jgi:hypothetical protein
MRPRHRRGRVTQQQLQHSQRQPLACFAERRRGHRHFGQVPQMSQCSIEAEDLQHKQMNRRHRIELAAPIPMPQTLASAANRLRGEIRLKIRLDASKNPGDTGHPWPPVGW